MDCIIYLTAGGLKPEKDAASARRLHLFVAFNAAFSDTHKDKDLAPFFYLPDDANQHIVRIIKVIAGLKDDQFVSAPVHSVFHRADDFARRHPVSPGIARISP